MVETITLTKICNDLNCEHKGKPQPLLENFYRKGKIYQREPSYHSMNFKPKCKSCESRISNDKYFERSLNLNKKRITKIKEKYVIKNGEKICSRKRCLNRGKPQPLNNFGEMEKSRKAYKNSIDKKDTVCLKCRKTEEKKEHYRLYGKSKSERKEALKKRDEKIKNILDGIDPMNLLVGIEEKKNRFQDIEL